ncbi:uncharacterized protein LOC122256399 [Penaeus japonicus]|uniref:uncharacterized protein LOC122256399 n=1 Tax=Penaeus japonicus TaxID=27405 RepID=UPI001C712467|nr:uncharacterized protein LOC122256399 [Penaeus japonicus]
MPSDEEDKMKGSAMDDGDWETSLKKRRASAKTQFTRKVNLFHDRAEKGDAFEALRHVYCEIEGRFKTLEFACEKLIEYYVDSACKESVITEATEYLNECEQTKCDTHCKLIGYQPKDDESGILQEKHSVKLKIEPMKLPKFGGNIRNFPGFIDEFNSIVVPSYGKNPAVLKQCLEGDPLRVIIGCERDYNEMISQLKKEYGEPRKLVDEVINDLKELKCIPDNDEWGFIHMVRKVERCFLDLKKVNLEREMNCVNIVSMIESILPREQKRRWVLRSQDISDSTQYFAELLGFLTAERKVIEYCQSSVRSERSKRNSLNVNVCRETDSQLLEMIKGLQDELNDTKALVSQVCMKVCNHITIRDEVRGEQWCWVHEFNGHDTSVCGKFRSMSASERLELAKKRGSCFICLRVGHISKNCNQIRKCTVKINDALCNRRHHSLLHEAFTKGIGAVISSGCSVRPTVLLDVTTVYSPSNVPIKVLWDSGSNITLITHRMARKLGSQGIPVSGTMTKVGNVAEEFSSKEYRVELVDKWGKKHNIVATAIDEITSVQFQYLGTVTYVLKCGLEEFQKTLWGFRYVDWNGLQHSPSTTYC